MKKILILAGSVLAALALFAGASTVLAGDGENLPDGDAAPAAAPEAVIGSSELLFHPVDLCRFLDTRGGPGLIMQPGQARGFDAVGSTKDYSGQGGSATGCGVPTAAVSVEMTFTAVGSEKDKTGSARVWPSDKPIPADPSLTYSDLIKASTTATIPICKSGCGGFDIKAQVTKSSAHLVGGISGYYIPRIKAVVNQNGTLARGTRVISSTRSSTGTYIVRFDRDIRSCAYVGTIGLAGQSGSATPGSIEVVGAAAFPTDGLFITTHDAGGTNSDRPFHLHVIC